MTIAILHDESTALEARNLELKLSMKHDKNHIISSENFKKILKLTKYQKSLLISFILEDSEQNIFVEINKSLYHQAARVIKVTESPLKSRLRTTDLKRQNILALIPRNDTVNDDILRVLTKNKIIKKP